MHFTALPLLLLAISSSALPVPTRRHVQGINIHPQAQLQPTPSANVGSIPMPTPPAPMDAAPAVEKGDDGSTYVPAGKMTNAQRMARGLGPNAPTRRSSAPHKRASQIPMAPTNNNNVIIRVVATTGENLGAISNNGDDNLATYSPGGTPIRFSIPDSSNGPFELAPDDGLFGKVRKLLGAIPHRPDLAGSQLGPGLPNFANIGQGSCDPSGLLGLNLPPLPLLDSLGGVFSGLPKLLAAKLPSSPLSSGSDDNAGGLGGLLNIAGPLNLLGGGSSPLSSITGGNDSVDEEDDSPSSSGPSEGLLGLQGLGLPSTPLDDDSAPFLGSIKKLASRPAGPLRMAPEDTEPTMQPAQSAIWSCDDQGNMGAVWQNPSGERVPAKFFTGGPCAHTICIAADVGLLREIHGGDVREVNLIAGLL